MIVLQLAWNLLASGSLYFLLALSFWIPFRTQRFFNLGHGVAYVAGAYGAYAVLVGAASEGRPWLATTLPYVIAAAASVAIGIAWGLVSEGVLFRRLRSRGATPLAFLLASFGALIGGENLLAILYGADLRSLRMGGISPGWSFGDVTITGWQASYVISGACALVVFGGLQRHRRVRFFEIYAEDPLLAGTVGVNFSRVLLITAAIGGGLGGLAGMFAAADTFLRPWIGFNYLFKGITGAVVGGTRSAVGVLLGAMIVAVVEAAIDLLGSPAWREGGTFVVLIAFLLFKPDGVLGAYRAARAD